MKRKTKKKGVIKSQRKLTPRQDIALVKLLAGATDVQAAKAAGVDRVTVYTWRHDFPDFAAELRKRQDEMYDRAMRTLYTGLERAAKTVVALTRGRDEAVRLRAADSVLDRVAKIMYGDSGEKGRGLPPGESLADRMREIAVAIAAYHGAKTGAESAKPVDVKVVDARSLALPAPPANGNGKPAKGDVTL
jgi:hypothetical protein